MSTNNDLPKAPSIMPWAGRDNTGDETSNIIGNRPGLLALRSAIDAALEHNQGFIDEPEIEFTGVRLLDQPKPVAAPFMEGSWLAAGCLLLALATFAIFLFGLVEMIRRFF